MSERIYEMLFIVPSDAEETVQEEALTLVEKMITEQGTLFEMKEWRKRRLAFPIRHKNEGVYHLAWFNVPSERLGHISMRLNQSESILRHSILRIDELYAKAKLPLPFGAAKSEEPAGEETPAQEVDNG